MNRIVQRFALAARVLRHGETNNRASFDDIPPLTPEQVDEARSFFPMEKFFIFGHARSGTTLLARLIQVHPEVYCSWQAHFFTRSPTLVSLVSDLEVSEWLSRRSNRWNRGKDLSAVVMRAASDFILEREARRAGKTVVGDKSPNNLMNGDSVRSLKSIYPDASLIFIVRDGRDTILSHRLQKFIDLPDQLAAEDLAIRNDLINDPQPFLSGERSIFTSPGLHRAAHGWVRNVKETVNQGKDLFAKNFLSMRFEDLLDDPFSIMQPAWNLLGVDSTLPELEAAITQEMSSNPDADWQRQTKADLADKIRKGVPGSWQDVFTEQDKQIFKEIAGDSLIEWGYEQDHNW